MEKSLRERLKEKRNIREFIPAFSDSLNVGDIVKVIPSRPLNWKEYPVFVKEMELTCGKIGEIQTINRRMDSSENTFIVRFEESTGIFDAWDYQAEWLMKL